MLTFKQTLLAGAMVSVLAACGGGGGSAGTPGGSNIGGGSAIVPAAQALLTLSVSDISGNTTNTLSGNGLPCGRNRCSAWAPRHAVGRNTTAAHAQPRLRRHNHRLHLQPTPPPTSG